MISSSTSNSNINIFGNMLTNIANATTNLDQDMKNTAEKLGISTIILSKMMLSTDPVQINFINCIHNISNALKVHQNNELAIQLEQQIDNLRQEINNNQLDENSLPSYFDSLYLYNPNNSSQDIDNQQQDMYHQQQDIDNQQQDIDNQQQDMYYQQQDMYHQQQDIDHQQQDIDYQVNLIPIDIINIKNDVCVICFGNLNKEKVVETKCKHQYHDNCITHWLRIKNSCPLCNTIL